MLDHVGEKGHVPVAEGAGGKFRVHEGKAAIGVRPGSKIVPDETELEDLLFVPERAIVNKRVGDVALSREDELSLDKDVAQSMEMVFIDRLVGNAGVLSDCSSELEVGVAPFLGHFSPLLVCLVHVSGDVEDRGRRCTMSDALIRTRLDNEAAGELSASLAASQSAFVTLVRQSTQVPNTSKKSAFG